MSVPTIDLTFPHNWRAEVLVTRPIILPPRNFVFPQQVEEVERGALEVLVRPNSLGASGLPVVESGDARPFLATCALGFRDPGVPTGIWSTPDLDEVCAVAGGYAYMIDTTAPERFTFIAYRPVLRVIPVLASGLLLFVGHRSILAWGLDGQAWESAKLSDEGVTVTSIEEGVLRGLGWNMMTDKETPFALDLRTGSAQT